MDSALTEGLAGEKIKVTLEGEPVGIEVGAEEEADPEAEALVGTAAAPRDEAEEAVMVGKLGMEEVELDMLVTAGMEVEVEVLRAAEEAEAAEEEATEEVEVIVEETMLVEVGAEDEEETIEEVGAIEDEEETTSSMFIIDSLTSSTESDIDCKRSCEAAAGFQSG